MNIKGLRAKHAIFRYQSFGLDQTPQELVIKFNFLLEPDVLFQTELRIPLDKDKPVDEASLEPWVFSLGLVEAISYWKAACSPDLVIEAGALNEAQIAWWHDLFLHGLGEFFYQNQIDFTQSNLLTLKAAARRGGRFWRAPRHLLMEEKELMERGLAEASIKRTPSKSAVGVAPVGDLILVGGGKDSVVTLELTKDLASRRQVMLLNPTPAMLKVAEVAGFSKPLIIKRTIDPKLLELNRQGYLNGHTPFSAYLAFLSLLVGKIHGFKQVIASNEESASQGNVIFHRLEINHQYSKSFRFEKMFREYSQDYLSQEVNYFSFLRPLSELQIALLFSRFGEYFPVFNSCNVGRGVHWCGRCPKCAFVFLVLSPFVATDELVKLFGADLLDKEELKPLFLSLVGASGHKPFDCVGTKEEAGEAVSLTIAKYQKEGRVLPKALVTLKDQLEIKKPVLTAQILNELKSHWSNEHFLPKNYEEALHKGLDQ